MSRSANPRTGKYFYWALFLGDASIGAWLWFSFWKFSGQTEPTLVRVLVPAVITAVLAVALGTHRLGPGLQSARMAMLAGLGLAVWAVASGAVARGWLPATNREAQWLGAATAVMLWILRAFYWRIDGMAAARAGELVRWTLVALAATLVMLPFYFGGSVGAGDAHWYTVMLSDFLAQLKAGVFPVWVGQSPFAFNGAVSPIRFAPAFQYYGGVVDFLTAHALQPVAVKNLCLALSAIGGAFAAYGCLRPAVNGRHWIACLLAILWIASPGVLAPAFSGDQYMTFVAMPFVPVVLYGCWSVLERDDLLGRLWISLGLAGLWLCHPPVGLWMTVIAAALYVTAMLIHRNWLRELKGVALMAAVFLAMGSFPFVSLLCLDNQIHVPSVGSSAAIEVHRYFPGNFKPINPAGGGLFDYQIGYALLGTLAASLVLIAYSRRRAAWAFAAASILIVPFTVPVPLLTGAIWGHLPSWFVTINNVWPMQRLFLIWSAFAAFTGCLVLGSPRVSGAIWRHALVVTMLACGLLWSASEARKLGARIQRTRESPSKASLSEGLNNTELGRYAYSSFEYPPGYASHGYMDAWFENRLLDSRTREPFLTNADAAAPGDGAAAGNSTLISKGLMSAENITDSTSYFLRPTLTLDVGKRYALRLEFFDPETSGTLQLMQETMIREYILPDSGVGIRRNGPPEAFGTEATSGKVISMSILGQGPAALTAILITPRPNHKNFVAGRYWLYTYERSRLPIAVEAWTPYRVRFTAPRSSFLESPRMWLKDWRATVNGIPVPAERSPENLVMVPVEAGPNTVTLEYVPPFAVSASFWIMFLSWLVAGAAAVGWLVGMKPPRAAGLLAFVGRHRFLLLGALAAAAVFAARRTAASHGNVPASGPVEVRFLLPHGKIGASEALVSTGHAQAGAVVFATMLDEHHVRLGAEVSGSLYRSEPIEIDYSQMHTLVVSDSALFPTSNPMVSGLPAPEQEHLRHELRLELDGVLEMDASCYAFETTPSEIEVGSVPFASAFAARFTGRIVDSRRLPIPRVVGMPWGDRARLNLRFPTDRTGSTESLVTFKTDSGTLSYSVTYVNRSEVRIASSGLDGVAGEYANVDTDMSKTHSMVFVPSEPTDPRQPFEMSCEFDGKHILGGTKPRVLAVYPQLSLGANLLAHQAPQIRFSGPELRLEFTSDGAPAGSADEFGAMHMIVMLPARMTGRHEPILTTGHAGAGDEIYIVYEDPTHIRIGFDHWSVGGNLSKPIEVDYAQPHEIWVSEGTLYPEIGDDAHWGTIGPATRKLLKSLVAVEFDGETVLKETSATYPSTLEEVTPAKNRIGSSTADPDFSGILRYSERTGSLLPPGLKF